MFFALSSDGSAGGAEKLVDEAVEPSVVKLVVGMLVGGKPSEIVAGSPLMLDVEISVDAIPVADSGTPLKNVAPAVVLCIPEELAGNGCVINGTSSLSERFQ